MTKTDPRLALVEDQRRYEWDLARSAASRTAADLVRGRTHDLMNFIQVVQLTAQELERRAGSDPDGLLADLKASATSAQHQVSAMVALARPDLPVTAGAPIGPALAAAIEAVRGAAIDLRPQLTAPATLTTRCSAAELAHLVFGLALAATATDRDAAVDLVVRERVIDRAPWLELLCGSAGGDGEPPFELRAVDAIAEACGGELSSSERRGGGIERIVALPVVG